MYLEDQLLPISALQHLLFCRRQCALIHVEGLWAENRLTVEGQVLHKRAHEAPSETRAHVRTCRGLPLRSFRLGVVGKSDVVVFEFPTAERAASWSRETARAHEAGGLAQDACDLRGVCVTPVEYKRGKPKADDCDRVQVAAQAICLEEMLGVEVRLAAIYYGQRRRRTDVPIDAALRERTARAAGELHDLIASRATPGARGEPKCDSCSLVHLCLPDAVGSARTAAAFARSALLASVRSTGPSTDPFDT